MPKEKVTGMWLFYYGKKEFAHWHPNDAALNFHIVNHQAGIYLLKV